MNQILIQATSASTLSAAYQEANTELLNLHGVTTPGGADFTITSELAPGLPYLPKPGTQPQECGA